MQRAGELAGGYRILDGSERDRHGLEGAARDADQRGLRHGAFGKKQPAMRRGAQEIHFRPRHQRQAGGVAWHQEGREALAPASTSLTASTTKAAAIGPLVT